MTSMFWIGEKERKGADRPREGFVSPENLRPYVCREWSFPSALSRIGKPAMY